MFGKGKSNLGEDADINTGSSLDQFGGKYSLIAIAFIVVGVLSVGFLATGGLESIQNLGSDFGIGGPEVPQSALNPPGDDSRESMRYDLIENGIDEKDIGDIRNIGEKQRPNGNEEFVFNKSNLPEKVPLSEYIVINNVEILSEYVVIDNVEILKWDKVRYEVENTASVEKDMPFVELQIFVNIIRPSGDPYKLQIHRATSIEFGEEKMLPGEKRVFETMEPWEILKEAGYEKEGFSYNGIDSIWFEINDFESLKGMV